MPPAARENPKKQLETAELRRRAETQRALSQANEGPPQAEADTQRLVHELQVHQIELEMQNKELQRTRAEIEDGLQQYTELYDFAPVGYFTLASDSTIIRANLKGANLLGLERALLVGRRLSLFIENADLPIFYGFLKNVFEGQTQESCEVNLCKGESLSALPEISSRTSDLDIVPSVVRIEAEIAEDKQTCRAVMIDISEHRQMENKIRYLSSFPLSNPNPVIEIGRDRQIIYANPAASALMAQLNQLDAGFFLPSDFDELLINLDRGPAAQFYREVKIGKHIFGENIHVAPELNALRLYITDITERKKAEEVINRLNAEKSHRLQEIAISEERARMAREIHDGIAQDLIALKMRSHNWKELIEQSPHKMDEEINIMHKLLDNDIQETRRSIFALRPLTLDDEGFFPSIKEYVKVFGDLNKLTANILIDEEIPKLNEGLELGMFRIIQESLNNVAKHAKAKNVWVSFKKNPGSSLTIEIRDDGVGFNIQDVNTMNHRGHFGLAQLQDRVRENFGKFEIASEINKGVSILISLPIREKLA